MTTEPEVLTKKRELETLRRRIAPGSLDALEHSHRIDITYTSCALDGNTLTAGETALLLEKGIAIGGKPIAHHLQVMDHAQALELVADMAEEDRKSTRIRPLTETAVRVINYTLLARTKAGASTAYTKQAEDGTWKSDVDGPPPSMIDFCTWLKGQPDTPETAFEAHHRLGVIRPFVNANANTARLLMNYILLRGDYPAIAVRAEDGPAYLAALDTTDSDDRNTALSAILFSRLDQALDLYLSAAGQAQAFADHQPKREP
ncbi:Fic family protein [Allomesorhizobium camelthorni]|uniref:Fic family protein n=1 Tax=Allomesorhizobium camelthorni TaxID=475069 RepID=A0A6G4WJQ0_9HYPH|nr:Fic family protein [Mesorhizobium camelthorni]NGO54588.1 Fic family protein [Mesorhizobium camelthorni]